MSYVENRAAAARDGVWPDSVVVDDCHACPFFGVVRDKAVCLVQRTTARVMCDEEDFDDAPPEWCPLRVGAIRIVLKVAP